MAYRKKRKCWKMKLMVEQRRFEPVVARRKKRNTLVDKLGHRPVEHNLVDKLACRKMYIVVVVAGRQRSELVVAQRIEKNTLVGKLEHKQPEHMMVDKMAYTKKHIGSVDSVGQRQLVVDCCYSCFQNIHWYRMEDKLACMMKHIAVVVAGRR